MGWAWYAARGFAGAVVALDPDRAVSLARSIPSESLKQTALADMAKAVAAADPDRAECLAQSITDRRYTASALVDVVKSLTHGQ